MRIIGDCAGRIRGRRGSRWCGDKGTGMAPYIAAARGRRHGTGGWWRCFFGLRRGKVRSWRGSDSHGERHGGRRTEGRGRGRSVRVRCLPASWRTSASCTVSTGRGWANGHVLGVSGEVAELTGERRGRGEVSNDEGGRRPCAQSCPSAAWARLGRWRTVHPVERRVRACGQRDERRRLGALD